MALAKADIVETVQSELGFPKHQSTELVESLLEPIKSKLKSGEDVLVNVLRNISQDRYPAGEFH